MASSHHHHCHHPPPLTTPCCCTCAPSHHSPPPPSPPPPQADPLLQSIAAHLLLHPPQPQPHPHVHSPHLNQPDYHRPQINKHKRHSRKYLHLESDDDEEEQQSLPIVSSLLRRIAALETSLRHHSPARYSLRHAAARTIQTHFRAFLVCRSRTLRQLKDLAFIKSALSVLQSSISDSTHFDYHALSQETIGLLIKLESIKGGDPMIRDGKRSMNRELIRFLEFTDEVSLKRQVLYSSRVVKNVGFGKNGAKSRVSLVVDRKKTADSEGFSGDERKLLEKLRNRVEKIEELSKVYEEEDEENIEVGNKDSSINGNRSGSQTRVGGLVKRKSGVQPKAKKNVSFVENGNVYRIINGPGSSGDSDSIDEDDLVDGDGEIMNNLCKQVEEIGVSRKEEEEDGTEETESTEMSDDEKDHQRGNVKQVDQDEDDGFVFSAPLPVKMETRADLMNKKHPLRK